MVERRNFYLMQNAWFCEKIFSNDNNKWFIKQCHGIIIAGIYFDLENKKKHE